ncbi:MAG: DUF421 domain-containing protein [Clostridia bacterium]|nr:DUF421 domain-containing protein [Clostridia bacterium]
MVTICIRTVVMYVLVSVVFRFLGKRQVGELEISDLITTLLLSEIATMAIDEPDIPLFYAIIPILLIACFEIVITYSKIRCSWIKRIFEDTPIILIEKGKICEKPLAGMRMTVDELLSECRLQGFGKLEEINYAILEQNGKLSILPFEANKPITPAILGKKVEEAGIMHALIVDGKIAKEELKKSSFSEENLYSICRRHGAQVQDVLLCGVDDAGHVTFILKEKA